MSHEQFAIWLHGFLEISNAETINKEQTQIIKDHLALLFEKKTPDRTNKINDNWADIQRKIKEWEEAHPRKATPLYPSYPPGFCWSYEHKRYDDIEPMTQASHRYEIVGNIFENPELLEL